MYSLENTTDLTALGDAIRAKTGDSNEMTVAEMATAVAGITAGTTGVLNYTYWYSNTSGGYSGRYRTIAKNTNVNFTIDGKTPNKFYLFFEPCTISSSTPTSQNMCVVLYDNGTITYLNKGGILTIPMFTITVAQTNGNTIITFRHSQSSGTIGLLAGTGSSYLYCIYID